METVRFAVVALLVGAGILTLLISLYGTYRFRFALNRMHSASVGDTMGLLLVCTGLIVAQGFTWASAKLLLIVILMWTASPVAGHLIAQLECKTDEELTRHMEIRDETEDKHADL